MRAKLTKVSLAGLGEQNPTRKFDHRGGVCPQEKVSCVPLLVQFNLSASVGNCPALFSISAGLQRIRKFRDLNAGSVPDKPKHGPI